MPKNATSLNLSDKAKTLLAAIALELGLNKSATLEYIIRAQAKKMKIAEGSK